MHPKHISIPYNRYLITCRCAPGRNPFAEPRNCLEYGAVLSSKLGILDFAILAYVFMPDHVHLLLEIGKHDTLQSIMNHVSGSAAFRINGIEGMRGRKFWQGGFHDARTRTVTDLVKRINYIHLNPVRKGLSREPSEYHFSSARIFREEIGVDLLDEHVLRGTNIEALLNTLKSKIVVALKGDLPSGRRMAEYL